MYTTNNTLLEQEIDKLQIRQLEKNESYEILSISLEAGCMFPEHISYKDAKLLMLQGEVYFGIEQEIVPLSPFQIFEIPRDKKHFVKALVDSKFLIIR